LENRRSNCHFYFVHGYVRGIGVPIESLDRAVWKVKNVKPTAKQKTWFVAGILLVFAATAIYRFSGFSWLMVIIWLGGLFFAGRGLYQKTHQAFWPKSRQDAYALYALLIIFVPMYFAFLYTVPFQMNTDEAVIMSVQRQSLINPDLFGLSDYFGFPSLIFIVTGFLAKTLGGIDILHVRLVHAAFGLLTVLFSYLFFRQFWKALPAFVAAAIIGTNHSLLAISRMAMRDNSALLVMVISLPFLFYGLKHKNHLYTYVGGALAALSFYVYHPGRILIFLWLGTLILLWIFMRDKYRTKHLLQSAVLALVGFVLVSLPLFVAGLNHSDPDAEKFARERFLFYEEGRELQKDWVAAETVKEGVVTNIVNGLTTFNNKIHDYGYIYPNYGYGFVDPITGVFIWAGVIGILIRTFWLKHRNEEDIMALGSFLFLWLLFSFVVNKSPIYTRLFVTLPFVGYLVVVGITELAELFAAGLRKAKLANRQYIVKSFLLEALLIIVAANLFIFYSFAREGLDKGNNVGGTARYIENYKDNPGHAFFLAADQFNGYYSWGGENEWVFWMKTFTRPDQTVRVINPENYVYSLPPYGNFTVFMNAGVWNQTKINLAERFPNLRTHNIMTDGSLVAVEVSSPQTSNPAP
jgi:4-amino-4-deoxy-L-arabinose transferase-like glycosyltransferase